MIINRRNFLKGALGTAGAVLLLPLLPSQTLTTHAAPSEQEENIKIARFYIPFEYGHSNPVPLTFKPQSETRGIYIYSTFGVRGYTAPHLARNANWNGIDQIEPPSDSETASVGAQEVESDWLFHHGGWDFTLTPGEKITSSMDAEGEVIIAGMDWDGGLIAIRYKGPWLLPDGEIVPYVVVRHGHCTPIVDGTRVINVGDKVRAGQVVGAVGSPVNVDPHQHFEILKGGPLWDAEANLTLENNTHWDEEGEFEKRFLDPLPCLNHGFAAEAARENKKPPLTERQIAEAGRLGIDTDDPEAKRIAAERQAFLDTMLLYATTVNAMSSLTFGEWRKDDSLEYDDMRAIYELTQAAGLEIAGNIRGIKNNGTQVSPHTDMQPGDLLLFGVDENGQARYEAVALFMGDGKIFTSIPEKGPKIISFAELQRSKGYGARADNLPDQLSYVIRLNTKDKVEPKGNLLGLINSNKDGAAQQVDLAGQREAIGTTLRNNLVSPQEKLVKAVTPYIPQFLVTLGALSLAGFNAWKTRKETAKQPAIAHSAGSIKGERHTGAVRGERYILNSPTGSQPWIITRDNQGHATHAHKEGKPNQPAKILYIQRRDSRYLSFAYYDSPNGCIEWVLSPTSEQPIALETRFTRDNQGKICYWGYVKDEDMPRFRYYYDNNGPPEIRSATPAREEDNRVKALPAPQRGGYNR